jgi:hypothetical protein
MVRDGARAPPHHEGNEDNSFRHCERSEAIHETKEARVDCFAALAMTRGCNDDLLRYAAKKKARLSGPLNFSAKSVDRDQEAVLL